MRVFLLAFMFLLTVNGHANFLDVLPPTATIAISSTQSVCQNSPGPTITFTGAGGTAPYTFSYTINGTPQTISTTGGNSVVTLGASTAVWGPRTYVLVSVEDNSGALVPIGASVTFTVSQQPDATINSSADFTPNFSGFPTFTICENQSSSFDFFNASTTISTLNSGYTINWGDGSPNFTGSTWSSLNHTYAVGLWTLTYTITSQNGCNVTKIYKVFVGNNPAVGLGNPGNTDVCISTSLTFPITGTENNPPGTTYAVTFNDGSPPINYSHPPPTSVTHNFLTSSCNTSSTVGNTTYQYSYFANITATNPCDVSSATVVPIRISTPPLADFSLPTGSLCVNTSLCFSNTSTGGITAGATTCTDPKIIWTVSPATGFSIASGSLGNDFSNSNVNAWTSGSQQLCLNFSVGGTYTVTMKIGSRCGIDTEIKTICVAAPLSPQFNLNNNQGCAPFSVTAANTTNLSSLCGQATNTWSVTHTPAYCGTSIAPIPNQTSTNASYNFTEAGTYTITLTTSNSCGTNSTSQTVIVKKPPTATINAIGNLCGSGNINPQAVVNSCAPATSTVTYAWSFPGATPSSSTSVNPGPVAYSTPGNYTVSLIVSNECGSSATATQAFTVNPAPTISNTDLTQSICSGTSTSAIVLNASPAGTTFTWTGTASTGVTGFQTSGTTNIIPAQVLTYTGSGTGTLTYVVTPSLAGCNGSPVTFTIQIAPAPTITAQPQSQTLCQNGAVNPLAITINAASTTPTYQWYSNTTNSTSGGTIITGATSSIFSPPAATVGTLYYYVVVSLGSAGCAELTSQIAAITIEPLPQINTQPVATQQICIGGSIPSALSIAVSGASGTPTYQWYSNTTNATSGGILIPGAISASYTPPAFTAVGTFYFYAIANYSVTGCGAVTSEAAQVIVIPDPVIDAPPIVSQTLCLGAPPQALQVAASGGSGAFSYQWYSNSANNTTTGTPISGATNPTFTPPASTIGTLYYYCVVTQPSTPSCGVTSATAAIIINQSPSITTQPLSSQVCVGGTPNVLSFTTSGGIGTVTFQWFSNTVDNTTSGSSIPGETNATFTPPTVTAGTIWYYAQVTFSGISGNCATISTMAASVEVVPNADITTQPNPAQTICVGATLSAPLSVAYSGGSGTASYQWYSNTTSSSSGGTIINGATLDAFTPPVFNTAGDFYYYVTIQTSASGCAPIASQVATVTVLPDPTLTTQPQPSQVLCQNAAPQPLVVVATGGSGSFEYQWYSNSVNSNSGGSMIFGETAATFNPPTSANGTVFYYCVATQPSAPGCNVTSATASVNVNLSPSVQVQPLPSEVCEGGTANVLSFTTMNGAGTQTYQWFSNTSNDTTTGNPISGETNATFTPPTSTAGMTWYYAQITFSGISGACATISTSAALVNVVPNAQIILQPQPLQTLCVGASLSAPLSVAYSGGSGAAAYQWFSNATNSASGGTLIPGATLDTYTPSVFTTPGTYYYYVTVQTSGSGCSPVASAVAQVEIIADPILTSQPVPSQTWCPNETAAQLSVNVSGGVETTYTYQWFVSSSPTPGSGTAISGATNQDYLPPTTVTGTLYYYCVIGQSTSNGCNAQSNMAEVTVSPAPQLTAQPQSQTVCDGQAVLALGFSVTNGLGAPSYQWFSNNVASNIGGTAIPGATSATYLPDNSVAGVYFYYCVISYAQLSGLCATISTDAAQINIDQTPVVSNFTETICSSATFTVTPQTNSSDIVPIGTTYTWSNPTISPAGSITGATAESNPQINISQQLINTTSNVATVTYTAVPVSGNCTGQTFTVVVTVNPAIDPNIVINDNLCFGADSASITTSVTGGIPFTSGDPYQFTWTGPDGFTSSVSQINNLAPGVYSLSINDAGGCPFSQTYTISEPTQLAFGTFLESDVTCYGESNASIAISVIGGTPGYTYLWTKDTAFFSNSQNLSGLSPGIYEVTATDANNCGPIVLSFAITEPQPLVATLGSQTNVECFGFATGAISVGIAGGTPLEISPGIFGYQYSWIGPNGYVSSDQNISNLFAGNYVLTVTDANNCQQTLSATITQSPEIIIDYTTTEITCYGANDANMAIQLSGGVGPYTFTWSNLATILNQANLSAGDYTITVTDALGCVKSATINIPEAPIFTTNPIVTQISCFGENDGSIQLNLTGGIAPVTLIWSDGSPAGLTRNALGPGTYTATITDSKPCQIVQTFIIVEPQPLALSAQVNNATDCNSSLGGAIDLLVSGGTPPYNYSWSNGSSSEDIAQLTNGNYAVTVTDSRGCVVQGQYTVSRPDPIVISVATQTDVDCAAHSVHQTFTATVSGGLPPYQLQWSSGTVSGTNNEIMTTTNNGNVILSAVDALGCTQQFSLDVDTPELGEVDFTPDSFGNVYYGIFSIHDPITFTSNITGDYESIVWDFGDGTFSNELNPIHTYVNSGSYVVTETVSYPFGCKYSRIITLIVEEGYFLVIPTAFTPNGDSLNDNYVPVSKRLEAIQMDVYDSWGSMIYSEKGDVLVGWDGHIKDVNAENGNYYCTITARTFDGKTITATRTFVLIK